MRLLINVGILSYELYLISDSYSQKASRINYRVKLLLTQL